MQWSNNEGERSACRRNQRCSIPTLFLLHRLLPFRLVSVLTYHLRPGHPALGSLTFASDGGNMGDMPRGEHSRGIFKERMIKQLWPCQNRKATSGRWLRLSSFSEPLNVILWMFSGKEPLPRACAWVSVFDSLIIRGAIRREKGDESDVFLKASLGNLAEGSGSRCSDMERSSRYSDFKKTNQCEIMPSFSYQKNLTPQLYTIWMPCRCAGKKSRHHRNELFLGQELWRQKKGFFIFLCMIFSKKAKMVTYLCNLKN